ncbi:acyl-CoA synthetase [Telluria aromaticivorans]|uniref:Acyl-CoA synthetase n=1 Tax=Telluria aromaticivorans TaxID=2725995 RepID=A0A7Y2JYY7_9BURK|nr:acyl-CoA synthetase [Telluria aromaticivorans]NNG22983.1 acyl-CoA synthetase [Telluria aromaticivorans]
MFQTDYGANPGQGIATLADIERVEATPWGELLPARTTYALLRLASERHPQRTALRFLLHADPGARDFALSYEGLAERVTQAANAFYRVGVTAGQAVALLLPNLPEMQFSLLGAQAAGIANPINPMLEIDHIAAIIDATGARVLVTLAPQPDNALLWDKALALAERCPSITSIFAVDLCSYVDARSAQQLEALRVQAPRPARPEVRVLGFSAALAAERSDRLVSGRTILESDLCSYFHTGGTTGLPKVAAHTHLNESFVACMLALLQPGPNVVLCGLPLFHVNGAMATGLGAFHAGWEVVMLTPQGYRGEGVLKHFWALAERFRASSFSAVPTILAALAAEGPGTADIRSLRQVFCGAAPLPAETAHRFEQVTGVPVCEGYGLTETACLATLNPPSRARRTGSVGLRLPHQQVRIWKVDAAGRAAGECAPGEVGVIGVCGPNVFPGYLRAHDNEGIWLAPGWLNTGDLGYLDLDGFLRLTGRAKDLIIRGGHNIDPALIEEALLKHPDVALAAAVGQPDEHAGELPVAFLTLKPGSTAGPQELLEAARALVPERAAVPVRIEVLAQMPLTPIGKLAKAELRMRAARFVLGERLARHGIPARVEVAADARHGVLATLHGAPAACEEARRVLGAFAIALATAADPDATA